MMRQDLQNYRPDGFERGRPAIVELLWHLAHGLLFRAPFIRAYRCKRGVLRAFGGTLGSGVVMKPGARVTFPWRLHAGEHTWIGEDVWILNLDEVRIGANCCISQRAFLCTGNHDWSSPAFGLRTAPITIGDEVWICANTFIGPGVTIGAGSVITAGSVVITDQPAGMICGGNPCRPLRPRASNADAE